MAGYPPEPGDPPVGPVAKPYSRKYVTNQLWILGKVLLYAHTLGADVRVVAGKHMKPAQTHDIEALDPRGRTKRKPKLVTLNATRRIAMGMHVVHQLVLWTMRLAGLRIGEVYGLVVANFMENDSGAGFLLVEATGGEVVEYRDDDEDIRTTGRLQHTKTEAGYRLIRVPEPLAMLFRHVIAAFHTDPATGDVNMTARLVPVIQSEAGGKDGFRNALKTAVAEIAGASNDPDDYVLPHDTRKAFATDLAYTPDLDDRVKRRAMGHVYGSDVFDLIYTLDDRLKDAMAPAAAAIENAIAAEIESVLVPTALRPQDGRDRDEDRLAYADAVLEGAGWQVREHGVDRVTATEAARHLGMSVTATRRLFDNDHIPAAKGRNGWLAKLDDVLAYRERLAGYRCLDDIAEEAGTAYHVVHRTMARLGLEPPCDGHSRQLLLRDDDADRILAELARIDALRARSMTVAEAAGVLRTALSSVHKWASEGQRLAYDPESDASGKRHVTRASVAAEQGRRGPRRRPAVTVAAFRDATGFDDAGINALVSSRALVRIRRDALCAASVHAWVIGHRPDLLDCELLAAA
jgi:integrase